MNKYFTSVFTIEDLSTFPEPPIKYEGSQPLDRITFTLEDIKKKIKKLNKFKAPGPDDIHPGLMKLKKIYQIYRTVLMKILKKD